METNFQKLNLSNSFLFAAAMEDAEICRMVLEIILGFKIPKVSVHTEHSILISSDFRSVRLDVYVSDEMLSAMMSRHRTRMREILQNGAVIIRQRWMLHP